MMDRIQTSFHFPEVRVVEASAGSGKTFALAKRYVQLLLVHDAAVAPDHFRQILAITFMKKASFEMKARIVLLLKKIALKTISRDQREAIESIVQPLGITIDEAAPRAFVVMEQLIRQYNFFQVQTIDAFINALLSGCAFKIGLSSQFQIKHNALEYWRYALDRLIDQAFEDPLIADMFTRFLDRYLILENNGSWFPKKDILGLLMAFYDLRNSYGMEFVAEGQPGMALTDLMSCAVRSIARVKVLVSDSGDRRFIGAMDKFLDAYKTVFDFDHVSSYFLRAEIPLKKGSECTAEMYEAWHQVQDALRQVAECEAAGSFDPYVFIFQQAIKEFDLKAGKDDVLFMEELNRKAKGLFDQGGVTPAELYYRMATRFRHYLIDEFQDTSCLQWNNIEMMIEEALSTGGSLFYVGDKKQAIYGFRGGDVRLFDRVRDKFFHFNVQEEHLQKNWRSYEAIVRFNNRIFSQENLQCFVDAKEEIDREKKTGAKAHERVELSEEDFERLYSAFRHAGQHFREDRLGGYVRVQHICGKTKEQRDIQTKQVLLEVLKDVNTRYSWQDIAILTRTNGEVEQITSWLMEKGVPVQSERTMNIKRHPLILELVACLKFFNTPADNVAFADFILGDVFERASGIPKTELHAFLFSLRDQARYQKGFCLYQVFRERYTSVWDRLIRGFFENIGLYPLYELMISMIRTWDVLAHFPDAQGFVMQFLEMIKRREEEASDAASLIEYFESTAYEHAFVQVAGTDAVRVLTVHKAKGLEFPVVILPFASMKIQTSESGGKGEDDLGQRSYVLDDQGHALRLMRIKRSYLGHSDQLYQIYRRRYLESLASEINNCYVALTRAEREMYVLIPEKVGMSHNLFSLLIPDDAFVMGDRDRLTDAREKARLLVRSTDHHDETALPVSSHTDWIHYLQEEFAGAKETIMDRQRVYHGNVLHAMLSCVGDLDRQDFEDVIRQACNVARLRFPAAADEALSRDFARLLKSPVLKEIFYVHGAEVFQEKEIVDGFGRMHRPDRIVMDRQSVRVIDYKSTRALDARHAQQMSDYVVLLRAMYPDKKVYGSLVYLDSPAVEDVMTHDLRR